MLRQFGICQIRKKLLTYSSIQVAENATGYEILIDGRKLRVPRTSDVLKIQSQDVAEMVALEWAGQKTRDLAKIQKHTLYMTQLCYSEQELSQTTDKEELVDNLLKYLQTDTCLFRSPFSEDESLDGSPSIKLCEMQNEQWDPIKEWFQNRFEVQLETAAGFRLPIVPTETYEKLHSHLNSYDVGVLIVIEKMCLALKSMMLTVMVIERKVSVEEAVRLRYENLFIPSKLLLLKIKIN